MKALALVESPFQLLCVREAIEAMAITDVTIIVATDFTSHGYNQILQVQQALFSRLDISSKFIFLDLNSVKGQSLRNRIALYAEPLQSIDKFNLDRLLIGEFRSQWQKDIASTLSHVDAWLLDDGTATLCYLYYHIPAKKQFSIPKVGSKERQKEADDIKRSLQLSTGEAPNLSLFTIFPQHVPKTTVSLANNLTCIYKEFDQIDTSAVIVIGSSMVELELCSFDEYLASIANIVNKVDKRVIYIPHRAQSKKHSELLKKRFPSIELLILDKPFELWLFEQEMPPSHICGFFSTAFFVADIAFPQLTMTCIPFSEKMYAKIDKLPVHGSDCFGNKEAFETAYKCLPKRVERLPQ